MGGSSDEKAGLGPPEPREIDQLAGDSDTTQKNGGLCIGCFDGDNFDGMLL